MTTEATEVSINTILPEELMIEILSRIELSNPLELRCVCKWWKSIVADPQFVESYLHRSFSDVLDLTSTAMEHVESFESHDIYLPADLQDDEDDDEEDDDDVTELLVNKAAQLDNFLVILECMKGNLNTMKLACVVAFVYTIYAVSPIPIAVFTWLMLLQVLRFTSLPLRFVAFAARLAYCHCVSLLACAVWYPTCIWLRCIWFCIAVAAFSAGLRLSLAYLQRLGLCSLRLDVASAFMLFGFAACDALPLMLIKLRLEAWFGAVRVFSFLG
ncbi:hypothetical protein KIW84_014969 [Lathyrus oleraceus]|uniref:F-box domain-containing protein n=1 Tax=Pisum sativum TaxID=3888 RepID=A0A9D5GZR0_PEA|nr:hypothetical protein KIW84_014969 [Pisum sativum]